MRPVILACMLLAAVPLFGQRTGSPEGLGLEARVEAALSYRHSSPEGEGFFDYPLHGNLGARYQSPSVTGLLSLDLDLDQNPGGGEPVLGPTYLRGGDGESYLQAGFFTADWGTARSLSVVQRLNLRDTDYPPHIFHAGIRQPNPMFVMSFGGDTVTQVALSRTGESAAAEDALVGVRAVRRGEGLTVSAGMVRPAGYPPPLFFLTAETGEDRGEGWVELGWWHHPDTDDRLNLVLGGRRSFSSGSITGEFVLLDNHPLLYLAEELDLGGRGVFSLAGFVYLPTFSTALDAAFRVRVDQATRFDLGTVLFFGGEGSYFSRWKEGNSNQVYLRLAWEYGRGR